ncbi:MAG: phosphatase PAP2 family protein [Bacilli bacterium]
MTKNSLWYDEFINNIIRNITHGKTIFYKIITLFANTYFLIFIALILMVLLKDKLMKWVIPINLLASAFLNNVLLKLIFRRERPLDMLVQEHGYSFPSGHSFVAVAFYGFLIYLIINSNWSKNIKAILSSILIGLILMIGISRIYLGVHYPTDVTAGFIGGVIYLIIFIEIVNRVKGVVYEKKKEREKEKIKCL